MKKYKGSRVLIIIDGYNLLKTAYKTREIDDRERERFIMDLVHYIRQAGNRVIVVFDGGDDVRPVSFQRSGVTVTYSGYRESADSVIKDLLEENQTRETLLISTDRELNRYAESFDIPSMDSTVFYSYMRHRLNSPASTAKKTSPTGIQKRAGHTSSSELDILMEQGSKTIFYKHDDEGSSARVPRAHKSSKVDKRLEKLVKKL